jgi:hypothetical protein
MQAALTPATMFKTADEPALATTRRQCAALQNGQNQEVEAQRRGELCPKAVMSFLPGGSAVQGRPTLS